MHLIYFDIDGAYLDTVPPTWITPKPNTREDL